MGRRRLDRGPAHAVGLAVRSPLAGGAERQAALRSGRAGLRPGRAHGRAAGATGGCCDRGAAARIVRRRRCLPDRCANCTSASLRPGRRQPSVSGRGRALADFGRRSDARGGRLALRAGPPARWRCRRRSKACCCRVSTACRRRLAARCRVPPSWARSSSPRCWRQSTKTPPIRPARACCATASCWSRCDRRHAAGKPQHPAPRYRFASTLAHDVAYQNLLLRRRTELHQRAGTILEAVCAAPARHGSRTSTPCATTSAGVEDPARGARYLVGAGRLGARHLRQRRRRALLRPRVVHPGIRGRSTTSRPSAASASTWATCWAPSVAATRRARSSRPCWPGPVSPAACVREARMQRKLAGLHWDAGERERSFDCLRRACSCSRAAGAPAQDDTSTAIERAHLCPGDGAARVSHRRQPGGRRMGASARCNRPNARPSAATTIRPCAGRRLRRSPMRSTPSVPRWPGSSARPRRSSASSAVSRWRRRPGCCRPPAAAMPISACCMRRSIRGAPSPPARRGWIRPGRSATSASSRACTRTWRWLTARSLSAATTRACRPRSRPSTWTANWARSTIWRCR